MTGDDLAKSIKGALTALIVLGTLIILLPFGAWGIWEMIT